MSFEEWAFNKIKLSEKLNNEECGASYSEAIIIICSLLSGIASQLWAGKGIDKKRFVELLINYSAPRLNVKRISLPIMMQALDDEGNKQKVQLLKENFQKLKDWDCQVLIGDEIDKLENDILTAINSFSLEEIRKYSYANILYTEIRSGFIHEYRLGKSASSIPMTLRESGISYCNILNRKAGKTIHQICFHYDWVKELTLSILATTKNMIEDYQTLQKPQKWWIEG